MLVFFGILGASMSTANGAMLVIAVVMARNVWQPWSDQVISDTKMLFLSGALVRPEPGLLLVVDFDIVFAGCVIPLFLGVYWPRATQAAAIASIVTGTVASAICYFVVPAQLAGLDTLLPPALSAVALVAVSLAASPSQELTCDTP